jgi:hypothetical protein
METWLKIKLIQTRSPKDYLLQANKVKVFLRSAISADEN